MTAKKKTAEIAKPFLRGAPTDENTVRLALKFFGSLLLIAFMSFIVCSMTSFDSVFLRILVNGAIEALILLILFSKGADLGTDGVARGEILYQHVQNGQPVSSGERKIPFHSCKGFLIGVCGTVPLLLPAVILALTAEKQMTGAGTLPSWMETFMRRPEIGGALAAYTQAVSVSFTDIIRLIVRIAMMPFVSMAGADNRGLLLLLERLSPLILLLPALAYGIGYLQGPARRKTVHTEIAENRRKRISREKRERKKRNIVHKEPEQLN